MDISDGVATGLRVLAILLVALTAVVVLAASWLVGAIVDYFQTDKCRICHQEVNTIYDYVEIGEDLYHLDCFLDNLYIFDNGR